jgi:hypothetical protein
MARITIVEQLPCGEKRETHQTTTVHKAKIWAANNRLHPESDLGIVAGSEVIAIKRGRRKWQWT